MNDQDYAEEYQRRLEQYHPRSRSYQQALDEVERFPVAERQPGGGLPRPDSLPDSMGRGYPEQGQGSNRGGLPRHRSG